MNAIDRQSRTCQLTYYKDSRKVKDYTVNVDYYHVSRILHNRSHHGLRALAKATVIDTDYDRVAIQCLETKQTLDTYVVSSI